MFLLEDYSQRQIRNPSYSLRAYARDLGIGVTTLSDYFAKKRKLSKKNIEKVVLALHLSPEQANELSQENKYSRAKQSLLGAKQNTEKFLNYEQRLLREDEFRLIADWYYLAILNLSKLKINKADPLWIADRLGISKAEAIQALERLVRLQLLKKSGERMIRTSKDITTSRDVPSASIRKHHVHNLKLAENSLLNDPVELREISSITMPLDLRKLSKAKDLLMETKNKLAKMVSSPSATEVYALSFQLFPLTRPKEK